MTPGIVVQNNNRLEPSKSKMFVFFRIVYFLPHPTPKACLMLGVGGTSWGVDSTLSMANNPEDYRLCYLSK